MTVHNGFWTLLGPDFAGKSTVLGRLRRDHGWRIVSYDDPYLAPFPLIRLLRHSWIGEAFANSGARYSAELVLAALHPIVLHLRDELARHAGAAPLVVDSYYYKLLAKCRLLGVEHHPTFAQWRALPRPRGVLYIDVPPEVAWARTGSGANVNAFEHYGAAPTEANFVRLQADLRVAMLAEVGAVPVTTVDGTAPPEAVVAQVRAAVELVAAR